MKVPVGRIGRAVGVRGEVTVSVLTDEAERRFAIGSTLSDAVTGRIFTVESFRWQGNRLIVAFQGVSDRSAAQVLAGTEVQARIDPADRAHGEDEFYDRHLVGLSVVTVSGEVVGRVTGVMHLPGQDILQVNSPGGRLTLIPFVESIVPRVDIDGGQMVVNPPPGLLDLPG
jgi:16S rRNA processing protein RimM